MPFSPAIGEHLADERRERRTVENHALSPRAARAAEIIPQGPPALADRGNNRRSGRARGSAPACRPAPASRARFPHRAFLRRRRPRATRCRTGPARRCDRGIETAAGIDLAPAGPARRRGPAAAARDRRGIPGHGHARRQLDPLPIAAQPLAGIELAPGDQAAREQPAQRRFGRFDGHRPRRPAASAALPAPFRRSPVRAATAAARLAIIALSTAIRQLTCLATAAKL